MAIMFWNALPFLSLPVLIILPFATPPFYGRNVLFVFLIACTTYGCMISPWPPDEGPTRPVRYGLTGSWIFVLPAIQRLLLHEPENEFRHLDGKERQGPPCSHSCAIRKACWAIALASTPRAVGWNIGGRKINAAREAVRSRGQDTNMFVLTKLFRASVAYLALDTVIMLATRTEAPQRWEWDPAALGKIGILECLMMVSVYSTMLLQFELAAAICVKLGLSQQEDWPPLFGSLASCYTVSHVWGKFWHGYIRQPVLGFGHAVVKSLGVPKRSLAAYAVHLIVAFGISAFFHTLSLAVVSSGRLRMKDLVADMGLFFMAQPVATIAESLVITYYRDRMQHVYNHTATGKHFSRTTGRILLCLWPLRHILGYIWVACWLFATGWWFVRDYIAVGVLEWALPFSIWDRFN